MRRASISIPSNLAEGIGRITAKERLRFVEIAYGSLMELECQVIISSDLGYISENQLRELENDITEIDKMLCGYRKSLQLRAENER